MARLAARLSLRVRLTALAALGAAVVLTAGALLLYSGLSSAIDDAVTAELRVRASDVAAELQAGSPLVAAGGGLVTQVLEGDGTVRQPEGADPLLALDEVGRAAEGEIVIDRAIPSVGPDARVLAVPVERSPDRLAIVAVAGSTAPMARAQDRLALVLGVAGPAMVVVVAGAAWVLTGAALRPVEQMTRRAETISLVDPQARLPQPPGHDEIAHLGRTLNAMLDRIADTVARERAFVDDASHELRSPLAVLRAELELAQLEVADGDGGAQVRAALESALDETDRLAALTERLLTLARADAGQLAGRGQPVSLRALTAELVERLDRGGADGEPAVEIVSGDAVVEVDRAVLEQVLTNLLRNALRWASAAVRVTIDDVDGWAALAVADDGPGFDPAVLDRAFDRFTRGDPSRSRAEEGTGLGLAIVAAIVRALGGTVVASNGPPLGGACVTVRIPVAASRRPDRTISRS